jgi:hypothetical protein
MNKLTLIAALTLGLVALPGSHAADKNQDKYDRAGNKVEKGLDKAGKGGKKGMRAAGEGVEEGLEATGDGVGAAVEHTSRGAVTAGKKTGQALEKTGGAIAGFFGDDDPGDEDSRANRVLKAQKKLKSKGHYTGPVDGIAGPQTAEALRSYQRDKGLPVTGQLDGVTSKKLGL